MRASWIIAAGFVADALWRRSRAARLRSLESSAEDVSPDHHFVTAAGVELDDATRRAASAHARRAGLDVLDLVPAGLEAARALELSRRLDPRTYRTARLAQGEGAGHALLVSADVLDRAGQVRRSGLSFAEMDLLTLKLKRYAAVTTDVAVAGIMPVPQSLADRRAVLRRRWQADLPTYLTGVSIGLGTLGIAVARRRRAGALVLAAACSQVYLATAGTPLKPADRLKFALGRPFAFYRWARVFAEKDRPNPELPRIREEYARELADGTDRFYERKRTDCPWCGSADLMFFFETGDNLQHRPGTFTYDRCSSCGHVFLNPSLTLAGLDFHYRDFYDGLGELEAERGFRLAAPYYRARARMLSGLAEPVNWLDVGGGHGHFCNGARDVWPDTRFDVLDLNATVEEADRSGWADGHHRGLFPELAPKLAGQYDVISMHHYLEHATEPYAELDAAATALPPGGHLLIEMPDPEWPYGRLVKRFWQGWMPPQHLHLFPLRNLVGALADRGLEAVRVERSAAYYPIDLMSSTMLFVNNLMPDPDKPWRTEPNPGRRLAARTAAFIAGAPLMATAAVIDQLTAPLVRLTGRSNNYRVVARKIA